MLQNAAPASFDVVGIGNAIVDVIAAADDRFLQQQGMVKGSMALINAERADQLYQLLGKSVETSGGSAANTLAGLSSLGGRGAYIGKVRNDQLGMSFTRGIRTIGVHYETPALMTGPGTARCMIAVTPDGQRTMNTYLGASVELLPQDIDAAVIASSLVTYLEGYLFDRPAARDAFFKASAIARTAGRKVALSLSDTFCVVRHREDFLDLVTKGVDILFANESEICTLYETDSFEQAAARAGKDVAIAALTRGEKGAVIVTPEGQTVIAAEPVDMVVDTTGAGDLYAAGFLFGYTRGYDAALCGRLGAIAAAECISHVGPRPLVNLSRLVQSILMPA